MKPSGTDQLADDLRRIATEAGASHFGIADLTRFHAVRPESFVESGELLTGVSILVPENHDLLDGLPMTDDLSRTSHYNIIMARALEIADRLRDELAARGFRAHRLTHPPVHKPTGLLKAAARLAGLGWIGKNRVLITPDYGPRVSPALVLTDAPLTPTAKEPMACGCGECTRCIDICPGMAFVTEHFGETDSLDGFLIGNCAAVRGVVNPTGWGACSLCVQVCPVGAHRCPGYERVCALYPYIRPAKPEGNRA